MANLVSNDFDAETIGTLPSGWTSGNIDADSLVISSGFASGQALRLHRTTGSSGSGAYVQPATWSTKTTYYARALVKFNSAPAVSATEFAGFRMQLTSIGTKSAFFQVKNDLSVQLETSGATDTYAGPLVVGDWYRIELDNVAGSVTMRIYDDVHSGANLLDTLTAATSNGADRIRIGSGTLSSNDFDWVLDNLVVSDSAQPGAVGSTAWNVSGVADPTPGAIVEIAFDTNPFATPTWTDVTDYVDIMNYPISIERGRADSFDAISPGTCTVVLKNDDKRFTPGYTSGTYGSNVKVGKRLRVTVPHNGTDYYRFSGYISSFDLGWPGGVTEQNRVQVTAVDILGMMEQVKLRNLVAHTYIASSPVALWPLDDGKGSGHAQEISGVRNPGLRRIERGSGGTAKFADGQGLKAMPQGSKQDRAVRFKSDRDEDSWTAFGQNDISLESATDAIGIGGWINFDADDDDNYVYIASAKLTEVGGAGYACFALGVDNKNRFFACLLDDDATTRSIKIEGTRVTDGSWHHVYAVYRETGSGSIKVYVDGTLEGTSTSFGANYPTIPATTTVTIGAARSNDNTKAENAVTNARFAYWGIWTDTTATALGVDELYEAGWRGWDSKDRTSARVTRVLDWMGVPSALQSVERGMSDVSVGDMKGMTALEYVNQVTVGEQGMFFAAGDGTATFHARDHRWDATLECTLSWHLPDETFTTDLEQIINTVTVSHRGGEVRVQDNNSRATYGPRELEVDAQLTDHNQAKGIGDYILKLRDTLKPRLSQYTYDLLTEPSQSTRDNVLALDLGQLFRVSSLPTQAHASSYDVWVEGIRETIGITDWSVTFITTPDKALSGFWYLGTSAFDDPLSLAY